MLIVHVAVKYYVGLPDAKKDIPRLLFLYNSASKTSLQ